MASEISSCGKQLQTDENEKSESKIKIQNVKRSKNNI